MTTPPNHPVPLRHWHQLTTTDFAALDQARTVAILPVGAIAQHGPHLPLWVDTCINEGIIAAALARLPPSASVLVLPTQSVGKSNEHLAYPGTLTLSAETLIRVWTEIGESVARGGVRKLLLLNSHGGQPQVMEIVARALRVQAGMIAVSCSWYGLGLPEGLFSDDEQRFGIHAGDVETSLMLHLAPELVRMDQAADFRSQLAQMPDRYQRLRHIGPVGMGWMAQDLHPSGACGNAAAATAAKGAAVLDHAAAALANLLDEIERYPLTAIKGSTGDQGADRKQTNT